ncbi:MAG: hypothetical protein U0892_00870 [Pirellulales bacterium]
MRNASGTTRSFLFSLVRTATSHIAFSVGCLTLICFIGCDGSESVADASSRLQSSSRSPVISVAHTVPNTSTSGEEVVADDEAKEVFDHKPVVLFDSYHAHNFIHRGLVPGEYVYHRYTGYRRAAGLLRERGCDVQELLVGPLTDDKLRDVKLLVVNLPSMDRPPWLVSEIEAVERYVLAGGGVLFITDHSNCYYHQYHLLPLWDRLRLTPTFETACEDEWRSVTMPGAPGWFMVQDFAKHPITDGIRNFYIQTGGHLVGDGIIAKTSSQAWADAGQVPLYGEGSPGLTGDMRYSDNEKKGPLGILVAQELGKGRIVVVSDQNCFGDAVLTIADNWRVWLHAVRWCGGLNVSDEPATVFDLPRSKKDQRLSTGGEAADGSLSWIESLGDDSAAKEEGRKEEQAAQAQIEKWTVHCLEPISQSRFHWTGMNSDQFYYFFCWLNRYRWTSCDDRFEQPSSEVRDRLLMFVFVEDLADNRNMSIATRTLERGGKVVLLCAPPRSSVSEQAASKTAEGEHSDLVTALMGIRRFAPDSDLTEEDVVTGPVRHFSYTVGNGTLISVVDCRRLANGKFLAPEIAPDGAVSKWEFTLRNWLFETPR